MILTYEAIDANGKTLRESLEATSLREAREVLRRKGLFVTNIHETSESEASAAAQQKQVLATSESKLPIATLTLFTRQMAMLLRAGSGIVPGLQAIRKQMKKPQHAALLDDLVRELEEGATLTDALRKYPNTFDSTYCAIVQAGEANATLPNMFDRLSKLVQARKAMRNKLLGSLMYPALLIVMSITITLVLLFFVLPRFENMFIQLNVDVPSSTKFFLAISAFLVSYWWAVITLVVAAISTTVWLLKTPSGRQNLSNAQTRVPVLGRLMKRLIQAQVFRTLGVLLESRVGVLEALELSRGLTNNDQFQRLFRRLDEAVTAGSQLSDALDESPLVDAFIVQAIRTGEESGNLGNAISYCADMLDESNAELVAATSKLIEPVILILMGIVVGGVAISLFMPLFDMTAATG